jgi:hypothetical protein
MYQSDKESTLSEIKETALAYQHLVEITDDCIWHEALRDTLIEYAIVKNLSEGVDFAQRRVAAIMSYGLYQAAKERLDIVAASVNDKA